MSKEKVADMIDAAMEQISETLKKAKVVVELHEKINNLLADQEFSVKMSILNIAMSKVILEECDDYQEALAYVARNGSVMVDVFDKHAAQYGNEEEAETEETNEPVH